MTDGRTGPGAEPKPGALTPFRNLTFLAIWIATLISNLGMMIHTVGASWLMTSLAPSADMVALVLSATTLPILLVSPFSGAIADTFDRRLVMLATQSAQAAVALALAVLTFMGLITPWILLVLTFLIGCAAALHTPSWQASVGDYVPRTHLPQALALNSMSFNVARTLGPAIGGLIVAGAGSSVAFVINAVSYIGPIAIFARLKKVQNRPELKEPLLSAVAAGVRYARESPEILAVLIRGVTLGLGASALQGLMPLVARSLLQGDATTYGALLGGFGFGAVAGALAGAWIRGRASHEATVRAGVLAYSASVIVVAASSSTVLTVIALFCAGLGWLLAASTMSITVQMVTPRWVVGRALALFQMAMFGGMALGSWGWGQLAEVTGLAPALIVSSGALLACAAVGLRFRVPEPAEAELAPLRSPSHPPTSLDVSAGQGPIVISIEYRVSPARGREFSAAMADTGRIRRRDGARRWTLLQDLGDPALWMERFEFPTWADYLRHRSRLTVADRDINVRGQTFHEGEGGPTVRRFVLVGPRRMEPAGAGPELDPFLE